MVLSDQQKSTGQQPTAGKRNKTRQRNNNKTTEQQRQWQQRCDGESKRPEKLSIAMLMKEI